MRTPRIVALSGLFVVLSGAMPAGDPRAPAAPPGAPDESLVLDGVRNLVTGFEFQWGNLSDPMKSKMDVDKPPSPPGPLARLERKMGEFRDAAKRRNVFGVRARLQALDLECREIEKDIRRLLSEAERARAKAWADERVAAIADPREPDVSSILERAERDLRAARKALDEALWGKAFDLASGARDSLTPELREAVRTLCPQDAPRLRKVLSESETLARQAKTWKEFPWDAFRVTGVVMAREGAALMLQNGRTVDLDEDLGDIHPALAGSRVVEAQIDRVVVLHKGERIEVPVSSP